MHSLFEAALLLSIIFMPPCWTCVEGCPSVKHACILEALCYDMTAPFCNLLNWKPYWIFPVMHKPPSLCNCMNSQMDHSCLPCSMRLVRNIQAIPPYDPHQLSCATILRSGRPCKSDHTRCFQSSKRIGMHSLC